MNVTAEMVFGSTHATHQVDSGSLLLRRTITVSNKDVDKFAAREVSISSDLFSKDRCKSERLGL